MSLEAIKQVTEAEQVQKQRKAEAQAEAQARGFMKEAEEKAAAHAAEVNAQTQKACDTLRAKAEGRLADAAASIVRRVVKN